MKDHTTNSDDRKTLRDLLLRALSAVGRKIFEEDDRRACDRGWQVVPRHGGLSRNYRDPRFDYLLACTACNGRGRNTCDTACSDCDGTGRVVLSPAAVALSGRGQP
jgi:RecJ-like exonuclease